MDLRTPGTLIVFGGCFDPPHRAHVALPMQVMQQTGARAVVYVPAAQPPLKPHRPKAPAHHRLAMMRLALKDCEHAQILTEELERFDAGEPSYTIDTLESMHERLADGVTLRLLIGTDQLRQFHQWKLPRRVVELAEPLVMLRPPVTAESALVSLPAPIASGNWARRMIEVQAMDISSTQIRQCVARGDPITELVDPAVEAYIRAHRLYHS